MPQLGEIRISKDVGYNSQRRVIWHGCIVCGRERWVYLLKGKPRSPRCQQCHSNIGTENPNWKGGKHLTPFGYRMVKVYPSDFFHPMANKANYIPEHRLVMARHLGRCLHPFEKVHHKNHNRSDNRIENLLLTMDDWHMKLTVWEETIKRLKAENKRLKREIKRLTLL